MNNTRLFGVSSLEEYFRNSNYPYDFKFSAVAEPRFLSEMTKWLTENIDEEDYVFIKELGIFWGVAFRNKKDAILYSLRWL